MKMLRALEIEDSMIVSTDIPEDDELPYDPDEEYDTGERVMKSHKIYESSIDGNQGNDPDDRTLNSAKWRFISATNLYKLFDKKVTDQLVRPGSFTISFKADQVVGGLALINVHASEMNITIDDTVDEQFFNEDYSFVDSSEVDDFWEYCFTETTTLGEIVVFDFRAFTTSTIHVTVSSAVGDVSVGQLVIGYAKPLGEAQYGSGVGITDYSVKERDEFGNPITAERDFNDFVEFEVLIPTKKVASIKKALAAERATPAVWAGRDDGGLAMLVYGLYDDLYITVDDPVTSECTLRVEGLV